MLRLLLEQLLVADVGLATSGWCLSLAGPQRLLFAELSNLLTDGDGHRMALDWKGASSIKPCIKHYNVFKKERSPHVHLHML